MNFNWFIVKINLFYLKWSFVIWKWFFYKLCIILCEIVILYLIFKESELSFYELFIICSIFKYKIV